MMRGDAMVRRKGLWTARRVFVTALVAGSFWIQHASGASDLSPTETARQLLSATDVHGGLVVHLGCSDGKLTAALHANDGYLVLGLDGDAERVQTARRHVQSLGLYGPVAIDRWDGRHIPLVDECVNLLVVEEAGSADPNELMRVVRPEGVLFKKDTAGRWQKQVKPARAGTDEWTHYLHDASNNAVAHDTVVGPPRHLQWVGSPRYSRHHDRMSSVSAVVSAGGRVFAIVDEASPISVLNPPQWRLVARDAYNGTVLWKRKIPKWFTHLWPLKSGPAQLPRRLVAVGERVYVTLGIDQPLSVLDAVTGKTIRTYERTKVTEEVIVSNGVLFALVNTRPGESDIDGWKRFGRGYRAVAWDGQPRELMALEAETGKVLWSKKQTVLPGTLAADGKRLVLHDGARVVSLNRNTGEVLWQSDPVPRAKEIRTFYLPTLLLYENVVLFSGGETAGLQTGSWYETGKDTLTALSAETGQILWTAYHPPSGYRSPEDTLVAGGLVWLGETTSGRAEGVFRGLDPHTGEVKVQFAPDVETYWFHHRCYRSKATDRYLLVSRTGTEFVDFRNKHWEINHWVRGACLYGVMPANGLLYAPQHPCACYL
ncbi:MAG TPA: methyltransferase domain-containing protein, partial [Planctomycetaceae bacterium]|nr:methyltransferase domain-containing protein [Planctomycetaceae bacterium]